MLVKNNLLKARFITVLTFLTLLVACGGESGNVTSTSDVTPTANSTPTTSPTTASNNPLIANYRVTFDSTWGASTHPTQHPGGAHMSPMVVVTHNTQVIFWEAGQIATAGTKIVAELGGTSTFTGEAQAAINAGTAHSVARGSTSASPGQQSISLEVHANFPQATFISMIAPSPDWFGGVRIDSLLDGDGAFVDSLSVDVRAYDAGTDDGVTFVSSNAVTNPVGFIMGLVTNSTDSSFDSEAQRTFGTLTFTKL